MAKGQTDQLLLRPSVSLIDRLDEAMELYGYRSRNEIAVEIIETYFEFWEQTQQAKLALLEQQRAGLFETTGVYARSETSREEIEKVKKDAPSRKEN